MFVSDATNYAHVQQEAYGINDRERYDLDKQINREETFFIESALNLSLNSEMRNDFIQLIQKRASDLRYQLKSGAGCPGEAIRNKKMFEEFKSANDQAYQNLVKYQEKKEQVIHTSNKMNAAIQETNLDFSYMTSPTVLGGIGGAISGSVLGEQIRAKVAQNRYQKANRILGEAFKEFNHADAVYKTLAEREALHYSSAGNLTARDPSQLKGAIQTYVAEGKVLAAESGAAYEAAQAARHATSIAWNEALNASSAAASRRASGYIGGALLGGPLGILAGALIETFNPTDAL